jgi:uncharacterized damage-inducible protein DinB
MDQAYFLTLYAYNDWANERILTQAAGLTPEQLLAPAAVPHGNLRDTLVHILGAEWIWRRRWEGDSPPAVLSADDFPTLEALAAAFAAERAARQAYLAGLSDEALHRSLAYTTTDGRAMQNTLWHLLAHLVNHGTQHRSEAAVLLTEFGRSPGNLDLITYLREAGSPAG